MLFAENRQSLIIEGCYLLPHRLGAFSAAQRAQIIPVFMGFSEGYLRRHFADGVLRHRSAIEQRQAPEERSMEWFIHANQRLKAMCAESGARYFEIDGDYGKDTRAIYAWIDTKMKKDTP